MWWCFRVLTFYDLRNYQYYTLLNVFEEYTCMLKWRRICFCSFCSDILQREDSMNSDALYVRGLCLYYEDMVDKAFQHFQQVLRLAPDHGKAKEIYKVNVPQAWKSQLSMMIFTLCKFM